jgi:hypothetical protein
MKFSSAISILSIVASASAFAPTSTQRSSSALQASSVTRNPNFAKVCCVAAQ